MVHPKFLNNFNDNFKYKTPGMKAAVRQSSLRSSSTEQNSTTLAPAPLTCHQLMITWPSLHIYISIVPPRLLPHIHHKLHRPTQSDHHSTLKPMYITPHFSISFSLRCATAIHQETHRVYHYDNCSNTHATDGFVDREKTRYSCPSFPTAGRHWWTQHKFPSLLISVNF